MHSKPLPPGAPLIYGIVLLFLLCAAFIEAKFKGLGIAFAVFMAGTVLQGRTAQKNGQPSMTGALCLIALGWGVYQSGKTAGLIGIAVSVILFSMGLSFDHQYCRLESFQEKIDTQKAEK